MPEATLTLYSRETKEDTSVLTQNNTLLKSVLTFEPPGLLEKPFEEDYRTLPMLHKKLFLAGKSGVGKTSTVDKLAGRG